MPDGVAPGDGERRAGDVGREHRRLRPFVSDGDGHASAARAEVGDANRGRRIGLQVERGFDDELGLRPRNQHVGRDLERQSPELAMAGDVGQRLARGATCDDRVVAGGEAVGFRFDRVNQKSLGGPAEQVLGEQPRTELGFGRGEPRITQLLAGGRDARLDGGHSTMKFGIRNYES